MSENGEGTVPRKVVARDPLAELGEIELAGVLRRVRPGPRPEAERRGQSPEAARGAEPSRGGAQSLSGRPPLPGASISGRAGTAPASAPPRAAEGGSRVLDRRLRKPVVHESAGREPVGRETVAPEPHPSGPLFELLEETLAMDDADSEGARLVEIEEPAGDVSASRPGQSAASASDSSTPAAARTRGLSENGEASASSDPDGPFIDGRSSVRFFVRGEGSRETAVEQAEIERRYEEGKRHAAAGHYAKAIQAYHDVLRHDPRHVRARNNLGFAYDCRGDFDLAINEYMAALELDPRNVQIQCNLGAVYGAKGRYDLAEEALKQAIRIDPKSAEAHCNLGIVYCKKGMYHLATAELKRALELQPDHIHAHYYLGECYNHLDRHEEAIQAFEKAIEGQPQNHKAYYNLGILYDKKNMPDRAMLMYRRAREVQMGSGSRPSDS